MSHLSTVIQSAMTTRPTLSSLGRSAAAASSDGPTKPHGHASPAPAGQYSFTTQRLLLLSTSALLVVIVSTFTVTLTFFSSPSSLSASPLLWRLHSSASSLLSFPSPPPSSPALLHPLFPVSPGRTLVVLVHSPRTEAYTSNLQYFVHKAVRCWQDADYRVIIQRDDVAAFNASDEADDAWHRDLPRLPPNGRYVLHENKCLDWGSFGWLLNLSSSHPAYVDSSQYRYFVLLNSGVRGPFLPDFVEEHTDRDHSVHCDQDGQLRPVEEGAPASSSAALPPLLLSWFHVFLARLTADVRYVGCTLNCAYAAHVQSYFVAFDFVALQVLWQAAVNGSTWLMDEEPTPQPIRVTTSFPAWRLAGGLRHLPQTGPVLQCPADWRDTVLTSEIGSSQAVIRAGYNVAVMMRTWQGVDFRQLPDPCGRDSRAEAFSGLADPLQVGVAVNREGKDRGEMTTVEPLEVVFVKSKGENRPHEGRMRGLVAWEQRANATRAEARRAGSPKRRRILYPHTAT